MSDQPIVPPLTERVTNDDALFKSIDVLPWPDVPFAAYVRVLVEKFDPETGSREPRVTVRYDAYPTDISTARRWAQAILRACEIAEQEAGNEVAH